MNFRLCKAFLVSAACLLSVAAIAAPGKDAPENMSSASGRAARQEGKSAKKFNPGGIWKSLNLSDASPYEVDAAAVPANHIDVIVADLHKSRFVKPAKQASDAVLCRRLYVDLTGSIPEPEQVCAFVDSDDPSKREKLVDCLMDSEEFSRYWALKFGDMLRIKAEFPINLWPNAAQAYDRFVYESISKRVPYDAMVRRMLCSSGSNFRVGEVNFYRAMQSRDAPSRAACVALTFMGVRLEKFPQKKRDDMAAFFDRMVLKSTKEWKEEIVMNDISKRSAFKGTLPDGWVVEVGQNSDPRAVFAEWLTAKGNPYFSRAFANRAWGWIFGRPLISPADDMEGKDSAGAKLLDFLAEYFETSNFDIRKLFKLIVMSKTYSQSFIPRSDPEKALNFLAVYPVGRLDAEVVIDALCRISETTEIYSSTTPEPYTTLPDYERATSLPDGSITTSFLELFGKPSRDTGNADERVNAPNSSQKLHLVNSTHIRSKLTRSKKLQKIYRMPPHLAFKNLYLAILSRPPTLSELEVYLKAKPDWNRVNDLAWALVNSEEFINRH